ncbi:MAG: methylated-DNA--[protein]-cysteine S-methyltransferase [Leptospiraceae bacterium]
MSVTTSIEYHFENLQKGWAIVGRSSRGICALFLGANQETLLEELKAAFPETHLKEALEFEPVLDPIHLVPAGDFPLDLQGTDFQKSVWIALQKIPAGQTRTYGEIANSLGRPGAARAVGQACGANQIAAIIPCHRAVSAGGNSGGFRWGLQWKQGLQDAEALSSRRSA